MTISKWIKPLLFSVLICNMGCSKDSAPINPNAIKEESRKENDNRQAPDMRSKYAGFKQLYCRDLKPGDIMLKLNISDRSFLQDIASNDHYAIFEDFVRNAIFLAQKLTGRKNAEIMHGGIMINSSQIVESSGVGIGKYELAGSEDLGTYYVVYRLLNPSVGAGFSMSEAAGSASEFLFSMHKDDNLVPYNFRGLPWAVLLPNGTAKSDPQIMGIIDKIINGTKQEMFCSQFVVYAYQLAAVQIKQDPKGSQLGINTKDYFDSNDARTSPADLATLLQNNPRFAMVGYMTSNQR